MKLVVWLLCISFSLIYEEKGSQLQKPIADLVSRDDSFRTLECLQPSYTIFLVRWNS